MIGSKECNAFFESQTDQGKLDAKQKRKEKFKNLLLNDARTEEDIILEDVYRSKGLYTQQIKAPKVGFSSIS